MIQQYMMDDYAEVSSGTALYPEEQALSYLTAGLTGEMSELFEVCFYYNESKFDANLKQQRQSEAGDVLWYLSQIPLKVLDRPFHAIAGASLDRTHAPKSFKEFQKLALAHPIMDDVSGKTQFGGQALSVHMLYKACRMNEMVKKAIRDNNGVLLEKHNKSYSAAFSSICIAFAQLLHWYHLDMNTVADYNIMKLKERARKGELQDLNRTVQQ